MPRDGMIPGPARSMAELTEVGLRQVRRLRLRRRTQMALAVGLTIALAAAAVPWALRGASVGIQNIAPIDRPDRPGGTEDLDVRSEASGAGTQRRGVAPGDSAPAAGATTGGASPSGPASGEERIAFASRRGDADRAGIYTMRPDTTGLKVLATDAMNSTQPAWSPDGKRVAYTSWNGNRHVYITEADGSGAELLTDPSVRAFDPAWSPDGRTIALSIDHWDDNADLFLVEVATGKATRLTDTSDRDESGAEWSPDGERIAFQAWGEDYQELYVMKADGSDVRRLTDGPDIDPTWSPDGRHIAFARFVDLGAPSIHVMRADGTDVRRLTTDATVSDYGPDWSPDGSRLLFTRDPDETDQLDFAYATLDWAARTGGPPGPASSIYLIDADGSGLRELTAPSNGDFYATWYAPR